MRLLIAMLDARRAENLENALYAREEKWEIRTVTDGCAAGRLLWEERWDLLLLHACLPGMDGRELLRLLRERPPLCPPRVLFLKEGDAPPPSLRPDCAAPLCADAEQLCRLLKILSKKPLPALATARAREVARATDEFLDLLSMNRALKGRQYLKWLLCRLAPSPLLEETPMGALYADCAGAFHVSPASVERCLRVAVESVFTLGNIRGIERFFGATVDPERGKPTNRAFLCQAAQQLRLLLDRSALGEEQRDAP